MKIVYFWFFTVSLCKRIFDRDKIETGYLSIDPADGSNNLFYTLFRSRAKIAKPPLILWLEGGPGCSGIVAHLTKNGPYFLKTDGSLHTNLFSWNNMADVLYIDQPLSAGYSYTNNTDRIPKNDKESTKDLFIALKNFVIKHPKSNGAKLYLSGDSYGGHFAPNLAKYILENNYKGLDLMGIMVGNGLFKFTAYTRNLAEYAYEQNLLKNYIDYYFLKISTSLSTFFAETGFSEYALLFFSTSQVLATGIDARFNYFDVREKCNKSFICNDFSYIDRFVNRSDVRKEMGVENVKWDRCSSKVRIRMFGPFCGDMTPVINYLLDSPKNIKIVFFTGSNDLMCNSNGMEAIFNGLQWNGKKDFEEAEWHNWVVTGQQAGKYKYTKNLRYYLVNDAGHMATFNQPGYVYDILIHLLNS